MSKYIIDLRPDCKVVQQICESDGQVSIGAKSIEYLEELNADYVNEHFGSLQDDAYKRGLEDGKAVNDKGCEGCKYGGSLQGSSPCYNCSNYYKNNWTAKDDKIGVGDVVETKNGTIFAVTKITADGLVVGFTGDGSTCCFNITKLTKTGGHYNINEILGGLCHD